MAKVVDLKMNADCKQLPSSVILKQQSTTAQKHETAYDPLWIYLTGLLCNITYATHLLYINQYNVEIESSVRWNSAPDPICAICHLRWYNQLPLVPNPHPSHTPVPTFDHLTNTYVQQQGVDKCMGCQQARLDHYKAFKRWLNASAFV